jgi:hypothetical protein
MATLTELIANVVKIRGFVGVYLDVPRLSPKQNAALKKDLAQLDKNLAALAAYQVPVEALAKVAVVTVGVMPSYDHVLTYDEEHEIFLVEDDKALKALGRPYGRGGDERGALPLQAHLEMAEALNLPLHVAEFKGMIAYHNQQGAELGG